MKGAELKQNNFDFLRLVAALGVILFHSYLFLGREADDPLFKLTGWNLRDTALGIFFLISGYLVTKSYQKHPREYWRNRFLRIFPALFVNIFLTIFMLGALCTKLSLAQYFSAGKTYQYLLNLFILPMPIHLPGVFIGNSQGRTVNGSLWSLGSEIWLYFYIWLLGNFGFNFKKAISLMLLIFAGLCIANIDYFMHKIGDILFTAYPNFQMACFFFIGAGVFIFKIKTDNFLVLVLLITASTVANYFNLNQLSLFLALPYLVFFIAFNKNIKLWHATKFGDFSYGIYIYAWLVQQVLVQNLSGLAPIELFIYASGISLVIGIISWHVVEKKALKLKNAAPSCVKATKTKL